MARSYQDLLASAREQVPEVQVADLAARRAAGEDPLVIDIREQAEWDEGHIPGSAFRPWHDLDGVPDGLDATRPIAVVCASGERAATGASLLLRAGAAAVIHVVDGGVPRWGRLGHPLERSPA